MSRRLPLPCVSLLLACLIGTLVSAAPFAAGNPVAQWRQALSRVESGLRSLRADDAAGRADLSRRLAQVRAEVEAWLATYPPARDGADPWLAPNSLAQDRLEDLAAEVSRLRAVLSRIEASMAGGGDGAFYLGRLDVAVSTEVAPPVSAEMAPAGAVVIDAGQLAAHGRMALSDGLALAPGVTFTRIGQRNETTVFVRGFDQRQVPLFVDGIPVYTPYDGYADLGRFTTFDVAELRVSKGFSSVLYGANALGGAINVISRRPAGKMEGTAGAHVASGSLRDLSTNLGTRGARWYAQGGGSYLEGATFPLSRGFVPTRHEDGGDRDNAGRRDAKFNVKLGLMPRDGDEYAISVVGLRARKGNPPYAGTDPAVRIRYWRWPYWDKDSVYGVSQTRLGRAGYLRGRAFYDAYDNRLDSYDDASFTTQARPSSFTSLYADDTFGGSAEWGTTFGSAQTLRAAAHVKQDRHRDHNVGEPLRRVEGRIVSTGVEHTLVASPSLSIVAGLGADWQTTTRAEGYESGQVVGLPRGNTSGVNAQVGVFRAVPAGLLRVTASRRTRLPTLKDRYSYRSGTAVPNPDLTPERATTLEAGFQGALGGKASLQAGVFYSRIDDLIQRVSIRPNLSQQQNVGRASSGGVEFDLRMRPARALELTGNYTYLDRDNLSDPSVPLLETPVHSGMAALTWTGTRLSAMASVEFEGGRRAMNEAGRLFHVPAFGTVGARVSWRVRRGVDVDLSATNLLDKNVWVAEGYPEAGRSVRAGVRWGF